MVELEVPKSSPHVVILITLRINQNRGFAAEAAIRANAYAYETLNWKSVFSCITEKNATSIALAEKHGATLHRIEENETREPILVYHHNNP